MTTSLASQIKNRICTKDRGWCFSATDFQALGNNDAIRQALTRLTHTGFIRRIAPGLFYYPRLHQTLGELHPNVNEVVHAIERYYQIRCQPAGAYAANLLGLSEQVPAKIVILTDAQSKKVKIGNNEIIFKKTTPKNMATSNSITGLIIQALKYLGKEYITDKHIHLLKGKLTDKDRLELKCNAHLAPAWIAKLINQKLLEENNG